MARPKRCRRIGFLPSVAYFEPRGVPPRYLEEVCLLVEELEAMRLHDVGGLGQEESGKLMNVSQPTFHRILESARRKVAQALVNGKALRIEGGDFEMAMQKFACRSCGNTWEVPFGTGQRGIDTSCPKCQSRDIHSTDQGGFGFGKRPWGRQLG
jgi:predicted DNA-binding protein (UPF0251 family)